MYSPAYKITTSFPDLQNQTIDTNPDYDIASIY